MLHKKSLQTKNSNKSFIKRYVEITPLLPINLGTFFATVLSLKKLANN